MANSLVKGEKKQTFSVFLTQDAIKKKINEVIGGKGGQRFMTAILSAVTNSPALRQESPFDVDSRLCVSGRGIESFALSAAGAVLHGSLQKEGSAGQRHFGHGAVSTGVQGVYPAGDPLGLLQKNQRPGNQRKRELKHFDPLNEEIEVELIQDERQREQARTIGYYAMFEYLNGFRKAMYWSYEQMQAHADQYSQAYSAEAHQRILNGEVPQKEMWKYSSFWYKDFDAMAYKTMLRQLISKWGIMSTELQMAMENDMAAIRDDGTPEYVDNADLEPQPVAEAQATEITPNDEADSKDFSLEDDFFAGLEPPPEHR